MQLYSEPSDSFAAKMVQVPTIPEWMSGKNLLVTGGTGYIGILLLEKVLRSCSDVNKIYIIIRPKWGKTMDDRFQELINDDVWKLLKFNYDFSKLIPIEADLTVAGMNLSPESIKTIHDNVNIVFHGAASIKFTEAFDKAVKANTRLTRDMVELAKGIKNLELFVHISTAYVNCNIFDIEEKVYPPHMKWRAAIELAETADPAQLNAVTAAFLGDFPNTYTFTKNMAEHVVWDHRDEIPILIFRPVIVTSVVREPAAGWTCNVSGGEAAYFAIGKGLIRITAMPHDATANTCPGDCTVNCLLTAAWKLACYSRFTGLPAANVVNSSFMNPPISEMYKHGEQALDENPIGDTIWREYYFGVPNPILFLPLHLIFNVLPGVTIQLLVQLFTGKKLPIAQNLTKYYVMMQILLKYFTDNNFKMSFGNMTDAFEALSPEDRRKFDIAILRDGETYKDMVKNSTGQFSLILKDRPLPLKERLRQRRLRFLIDYICRVILVGFVLFYFPYQATLQFSYNFANAALKFFIGDYNTYYST